MAYAKEKYLKTYFFKILAFSLALIALFLFLYRLAHGRSLFDGDVEVKEAYAEENCVIIIDPGHGGVDTGASGINGKNESVLCLEVAKRVKDMLSLCGYETVMTRTDDTMLSCSDPSASRKRADLIGRVEFAKQYPNAVFVSIHMNTYPLESCRGTQIFYSPNSPDSKLLADIIKNNVRKLQPDNDRANKAAGSNIYVLKNIDIPAVLVECGFLTNPSEERDLNDAEYQKKLALVIAQSICEYADNI